MQGLHDWPSVIFLEKSSTGSSPLIVKDVLQLPNMAAVIECVNSF